MLIPLFKLDRNNREKLKEPSRQPRGNPEKRKKQ